MPLETGAPFSAATINQADTQRVPKQRLQLRSPAEMPPGGFCVWRRWRGGTPISMAGSGTIAAAPKTRAEMTWRSERKPERIVCPCLRGPVPLRTLHVRRPRARTLSIRRCASDSPARQVQCELSTGTHRTGAGKPLDHMFDLDRRPAGWVAQHWDFPP